MSLHEDTGFERSGLSTTVMHPKKNHVVSLNGVALLTGVHHKSSNGSETEIEDVDISVF